MDYEKKYKEALERAKKIHNEHKAQPFDVMLKVFPEITESEDKRIREVLIDYFKRYKEQEICGIKTFFGIPTYDILDWLEKQKPINNPCKDCINQKGCINCENENLKETLNNGSYR